MSAKYLEYIAASVCPRHLREVLQALYIDLRIRGQQVYRARAQAAEEIKNAKGAVNQKRMHEELMGTHFSVTMQPLPTSLC